MRIHRYTEVYIVEIHDSSSSTPSDSCLCTPLSRTDHPENNVLAVSLVAIPSTFISLSLSLSLFLPLPFHPLPLFSPDVTK